MSRKFFLIMTAISSLTVMAMPVHAESQVNSAPADSPAATANPPLNKAAQLSLARDFFNRISAGFKHADQQMGYAQKTENNVSNLSEGETLLFQVKISKTLKLDTPLMGQVRESQ